MSCFGMKESNKYLQFLEHWADVLEACIKAITGQKVRFQPSRDVQVTFPQWPAGSILFIYFSSLLFLAASCSTVLVP